jgi:AraC-like DNA-binding protein
MKNNELFLSTEQVDPELRTDAWRDITRPFFDTTHVDEDTLAPLEGSLRSLALGSLLIGPTTFNRQQYRRDRRIIVQGGLDQYLVQLMVSGSIEGDCDGVSFSAGPGDICIFDLSRPFTSRVQPGSTQSAILPRERVDRAAGGRSLHGGVLKAQSPLTTLLANFITDLSRIASQLQEAQLRDVEEAAATLLASCLAQANPAPAADAALAPLLRRDLLRFIDANLADPELGPKLLTQRSRISRAHLYRMFAADGGVARVIRERRLDAAYRALASPGMAHRSITQIAFDFGFSSSGQFQRAFQSRFELSPSEARRAGLSPVLADRRLLALHTSFAAYRRQIGESRTTPAAD